MKSIALFAVAACSLLGASGCAALSTRTPVTGLIYTEASAGESVTSNAVVSPRSGEACVSSILGLIGTGDASINTAAKEAGITKITYVDGKSSNILGIYATYCDSLVFLAAWPFSARRRATNPSPSHERSWRERPRAPRRAHTKGSPCRKPRRALPKLPVRSRERGRFELENAPAERA